MIWPQPAPLALISLCPFSCLKPTCTQTEPLLFIPILPCLCQFQSVTLWFIDWVSFPVLLRGSRVSCSLHYCMPLPISFLSPSCEGIMVGFGVRQSQVQIFAPYPQREYDKLLYLPKPVSSYLSSLADCGDKGRSCV